MSLFPRNLAFLKHPAHKPTGNKRHDTVIGSVSSEPRYWESLPLVGRVPITVRMHAQCTTKYASAAISSCDNLRLFSRLSPRQRPIRFPRCPVASTIGTILGKFLTVHQPVASFPHQRNVLKTNKFRRERWTVSQPTNFRHFESLAC